jgi:hypothetical protein
MVMIRWTCSFDGQNNKYVQNIYVEKFWKMTLALTLRWILRKRLWGWELNETDLEFCKIAGFVNLCHMGRGNLNTHNMGLLTGL